MFRTATIGLSVSSRMRARIASPWRTNVIVSTTTTPSSVTSTPTLPPTPAVHVDVVRELRVLEVADHPPRGDRDDDDEREKDREEPAHCGHRPAKRGGRFSRKDCMPSWKSCERNSSMSCIRTWWRVRLEVLGEAVAVEPLHRADRERRVGGDLRRPSDAPRPARRSSGTTAFTRPSSSARSASRSSAEEADLAGLRPADEPRQVPGAAALRHDAALGEARDQRRA